MEHALLRAKERYDVDMTSQQLQYIRSFLHWEISAGIFRNVVKRLGWQRYVCLVRFDHKPMLAIYDHKIETVVTFVPLNVKYLKGNGRANVRRVGKKSSTY